MIKPKLHPRETERLAALESLNILDTEAEKDFDEITEIASKICGTPIALISLIDDKRQWFKSKVGLSAPETPKDIAFCSHAILQEDVFIIKDSSKDERFFDNPLATGAPHVQFYAGAPLLDPNTNLPIGTLCVIDSKPRDLSENQIDILGKLANQVQKLLDLRSKISNLKKANNKLTFQKTAFDNITEGVVMQDPSGKIVDFNPAALLVLGMTQDQLLGKSSMDESWQSVHEDGSPFPGSEHPAMVTLATGKAQKNIVMGIKTATQELRWIDVNSVPVFSDNPKNPDYAVTTFSDITSKKTVQHALFQSAKMTSLGEMAGGIAHEINTPLAIILSSAEHIQSYLKSENKNIEKSITKANKIETTAERIAQIVRGLRTFSRNSTDDPWQLCSLKQITEDTISLCREKFNLNSIRIDLNISETHKINSIPTQISQIILNILNNSFDAILPLEDKWVKIESEELNQKIRLRITDSGLGIPEEIVSKIMQPFFSTKQVGSGTGLGLSISKGIAEAFGGELNYQIHQGHTSFLLELPLPRVIK